MLNQGEFKGKPKGPWNPKKVKDQDGNDAMDLPCHIQTKKDEEGDLILPKHTTRLLIQSFHKKCQPSKKDTDSEKEEDKEEEEDGYPQVNATLVIFADVESKSRLKVINREVNDTSPTYL